MFSNFTILTNFNRVFIRVSLHYPTHLAVTFVWDVEEERSVYVDAHEAQVASGGEEEALHVNVTTKGVTGVKGGTVVGGRARHKMKAHSALQAFLKCPQILLFLGGVSMPYI